MKGSSSAKYPWHCQKHLPLRQPKGSGNFTPGQTNAVTTKLRALTSATSPDPKAGAAAPVLSSLRVTSCQQFHTDFWGPVGAQSVNACPHPSGLGSLLEPIRTISSTSAFVLRTLTCGYLPKTLHISSQSASPLLFVGALISPFFPLTP